MSLTEILFFIAYAFGLIGALFNPIYGILLYVLVYNLNPETQWWGHHVVQLGLRTSLTPALAAGIGIILNWRPLGKRQSQFPWMYCATLFFLFYAMCASFSGLQPLGSEISQHYLVKLMKVCFFMLMMIRVIRSLETFRWLLWTWAAGAIYVGYQAWSGVGVSGSGRMLVGGLGGPDFSESSGLAAHLTAMIAICGYLFYSSKSYRGKFFALLAAAYSVNTIIMTRTRNAFAGVVVLILFGILRLPKGMRLRCMAGVVVGLLLAAQLTDEGWWRRMETMKNPSEDPSIAMRFEYWRAAVQMAKEHTFGVGPGHFNGLVKHYVTTLDTGRSAHSTYFQCLAEMGFPGLLLFLVVLICAFLHFERARAVGKRWDQYVTSNPDLSANLRELLLVATANEVAVAGFLACAAFTTRLWTEGMWLLLGMSCCLHNVAQLMYSEMEKSDQPAEPSAEGLSIWADPVVSVT